MSGPPPPPPMSNRKAVNIPPPTPEPIAEKPIEVHGVRINGTAVTDTEMAFMMEKYLTPKQLGDVALIEFIQKYLVNRNASQSAREVGVQASRGTYWLQTPEIFGCIKAITDKALMKYGYDAHEIIERVKEIGAVDPAVLQNPDGSFKTKLEDIPAESRRAIKSFKAKNVWETDANGMRVVTGQLIEVQFWDKLKGLELLGREKQIMKETKRVEHDVTKNMASTLLASASRADERRSLMARDVQPALEGRVEDGHTNRDDYRDIGAGGIGVSASQPVEGGADEPKS